MRPGIDGVRARASVAVRRLAVVGLMLSALAGAAAQALDWQPVSPEELKMTAEPKAPGAAAIYLYRQVDRDDQDGQQSDYVRIKILTEEGRKYANVELYYLREREVLRDIRARTISPDGKIVNFAGTIYDKQLLKTKDARYLAKTFALPDVQVGSIIEYQYKHWYTEGIIYDSHWAVSADLFTRYAKFALRQNGEFAMRYGSPNGLPNGTTPPAKKKGQLEMEVRDVKASVEEEFMPPADTVNLRVEFIYVGPEADQNEPAEFWAAYAKRRYRDLDNFIDGQRELADVVAAHSKAGDPAQLRLRSLYEYVQTLRNLDYERDRTQAELKSERIKSIKSSAQMVKLGYGSSAQLNFLFVGLARAAGFQADVVEVGMRGDHLFDKRAMNPWKLDGYVAQVVVDGKALFFDPGTAFATFGLLPWEKTFVEGLRLGKGPAVWVTTGGLPAVNNRVDRKAVLQLDERGTLSGKLTVRLAGMEALSARVSQRLEDDASRKLYLEDSVKEWIPTGSEVTLTSSPDWAASSNTFSAEFDIRIPGYAARAGKRLLLPQGVFAAADTRMFQHETRVNALYFSYAYEHADDVTITLPANYRAGPMPASQFVDATKLAFSAEVEDRGSKLHLLRNLSMQQLIAPVGFYPEIQRFYRSVRSFDETQILLNPAPAAAGT